MTILLAVVASLTAGVAAIRWLRVAQREHYLAGAVARFAFRWWYSTPINLMLAGVAVAGAIGVWWQPSLGWLAITALVGPVGLPWTGRTAPLAATARMWRLIAGTGLLLAAAAAASFGTGHPAWAVASLVGCPLVVDLALLLLAPMEKRAGAAWVSRAAAKLEASGSRVVAITGSYGKTTTKGYVNHLLAGRFATVATPASFNNRMGLARAINEHLIPGTEVFIAEMGTYGPGEIAEMCKFVPPEVAVITSIGPVHLERFGSERAIVEAKREILRTARLAVVNIDHPLLAELAVEESSRRNVAAISGSDPRAAVSVVGGAVVVGGVEIGQVSAEVFGANLAAAIAVASFFEVSDAEVAARLPTLPGTAHRRQIIKSELGFTIVDDTYNANPAGALAALTTLQQIEPNGRRVVVTPGMVELGSRQVEENRTFAEAAAGVADDLLVVGLTNRRALVRGARSGPASITVVGSRDEAVAWVRSHLGPGDAVLYENDLPDHYP
ncbi:MAG: Mur ligase family protein [Actinomycetota bacterium]